MFTLRKGRVGMLAAGSIFIAGLGVTGASATGTPGPDAMVVRDGAGWYTQAYENTDTGDYTDPEQFDVTGPQRAPFGAGSHEFVIGQFAVQTELYRTNDYDGVNLGDLTRLEYSTFARNTAGGADRQPAYLRLNVDDDNDGTRDTSLFFYPANNGAVVNGAWQNWDVTGGLMNVGGDSGAGDTSLADYSAAHPDATLVNNRFDAEHDGGAVSLMAGAANTMTRGEYFVDRVIVGNGGQDTLFDFGPSTETDGDTTHLTLEPGSLQGWNTRALDGNTGKALSANQEFVSGPATPPEGDGSLKFALNDDTNPNRIEQFRTSQFDGTLVRDLRTLEFSTFQRVTGSNITPQQPVYLLLNLDNDGNGTRDHTLYFFPGNQGDVQALEQSAWQNWDADSGQWSIDGDGGPANTISISDYVVANPDAQIVHTASGGGVAFTVGAGGEGQMNGEYFIDAIKISNVDAATGSTNSGTEFDLEPTPAGPADISASLTGADNGATADKLKVNAPSAAQGATVKLFTLASGVRTLVGTATLNTIGNHHFKVADANGTAYTRYVAKVSGTGATKRCSTDSLRVR